MYERKYHDEEEWESITRDQVTFSIGGLFDTEMFLRVLDEGNEMITSSAIYRKRKEPEEGGQSMDVMTLPEAARRYGIPYQTLRSAVVSQRLEATRQGGTWLVTAAAIEAAFVAGKMRRPEEKGDDDNE